MTKIHDKSLCYIYHAAQVINIESSGKTRSPLGARYISALIAQLARSLRKWKVPGSNPTVGKNFSFCNSRFALLTG